MSTSYSREPIFEVPGGQNQVLRADRGDHVARREPLRLERHQVEVHLHLSLAPAVWQGDRRSLDRRKLCADEIEPEVEQLLLGQGLAR